MNPDWSFRQENHRRRRESCWRRNESAPPPGLTMKHTMDSDLSIVLDELSEATVDRVCCNPLPRDLSLKSAPGRAHLISTNILSLSFFFVTDILSLSMSTNILSLSTNIL
ncbi:hypothetical protein Bca4012_062813 [Brassica carinata]